MTRPPLPTTDDAAPGLVWGVKASFLAYLARLPDRRIHVSGGASFADGRFHFPLDAGAGYDPAAGTGTVRFAGDVWFTGHFGMLVVGIAAPWLEIAPGGSALTVAEPEGAGRTPLLALDVPAPAASPGMLTWAGIGTSLRPEGTSLFAGSYPPGEPFDPLRVVLHYS